MTDKKDISELFQILECDKDPLIQPLGSRIQQLTNITHTPTPRKEKYNYFFRELFKEVFDPLCHQDFSVDGIRCLLFIPEARIYPNSKDIKFYIKKSFEKAEHHLTLFPSYLPFVKAVIDSETSIKASFYPTLRETMVKKTVAMLQDLSSREGCSLDDKLKYSFCWINFGDDLKMGCVERTDYQMLLVPLLRFHSSKSLLEDEVISLDRYVESMPQNQKRVYYLAVKSIEIAKVSPFLATHIEVLILDGIHDKLLVQRLVAYKGYQFSDITKEDLREFTEGLSPATFGITDSLRVFVDGLTLATFQAIPEQDELEVSDLKTTAKDLSEWQEGHVTLVLGSITRVSMLRFALCPDVMNERSFWRIYFNLVNTHVAPYERKYMEELRSKAESNEDEEAKKTPAVLGTEKTDKYMEELRSKAESNEDDEAKKTPAVLGTETTDKYMEELRSKAESNEDDEAKKTPAVLGTETTDKYMEELRSKAESNEDDEAKKTPAVLGTETTDKYMEELRIKAESNEDDEAKKTPAVLGTETIDKNVAKSRTSTASSEQDDDSDEAPDVDFGKMGKKETSAAN
ncbi:uncharacterized protein LOC108822431 isoform X1 [Raphanus sativus]|uniref:Uncharacterized protein LOC108822431 isoform X1 n=1 Tax=Raphanus sativus TaxID=3726 RepID=A0A6J0KSX8_RAPSA|nr:uncharacterized protein LOC108822431 isoform X1 [Raphanus sativus]